MDIQKIKELALANGFKLKEQASGNMDLHSYVYEFANAVEQAAKAQAVPEWAVIVPKLSANYLFNTVPELGFEHQDQKDTVLYHLNYMASEFRDSAKQFVEDDHAKQKTMIEAQEPAND